MEDSHQVNSFQRSARCCGISQRRYDSWSQQARPSILLSSHQEQDRNVAMSDAHVGPGVRYTPYAIPTYRQRGSCHRGDQTHGNMERERKPPQEGMEENRQDGSSRSWFKVTFPSGVKYDEKCLQNLIQSLCSVPFNLIESQCQKMHTKIFVKSASIAFELKKVSSAICNEDNERKSIFVSPSTLPYSEQKALKSRKLKLIKVTKIRGYEVPQQPLDHQRLISDPDMTDSSNSRADVMTHDSEMGPNLRNCMAASLQIHEENKPKLLSFNSSNNTPYQLVGLPDTMQKAPNIRSLNLSKNESEGELDKVKRLEPEEMCADRNALCTTFPDKSTNISSILELFPKLLSLDNHEVPPPIVFGIEASKKLPVCRGSIFGSETLKNLILKFLQQYYWIYDYGDRLGLLDAYHDEACFSLTTPFNPEDLVSSCLDKYSKGSRNIKKLKDPVLQVQLLKHTKRDVVDCLSVLPRTQHDVSSFVVDMCVQTEKMLCFSVSGAFKEGECL
ncbi:nuclear RNA export factor 3-like isoform X1 [Elephas maximus indicus]|uniref:nuclear RNA export factor 3-like isoform X1 n=1 Tax=Elephas maximus indicus TaxID=99487 RepID=UPI00211624C1|nr:nuclear RNA export factor 3-like isoform X1 [Elephas maximus indicus]